MKNEKKHHREAANALRQEIIDTYDPPSSQEEDKVEDQQVATKVIVEKTVASKKWTYWPLHLYYIHLQKHYIYCLVF